MPQNLPSTKCPHHATLPPWKHKSNHLFEPASVQILSVECYDGADGSLLYQEGLDSLLLHSYCDSWVQWPDQPTPKFLETISSLCPQLLSQSWIDPVAISLIVCALSRYPSLPKNMQSLNCHSNPIISPLHSIQWGKTQNMSLVLKGTIYWISLNANASPPNESKWLDYACLALMSLSDVQVLLSFMDGVAFNYTNSVAHWVRGSGQGLSSSVCLLPMGVPPSQSRQ